MKALLALLFIILCNFIKGFINLNLSTGSKVNFARSRALDRELVSPVISTIMFPVTPPDASLIDSLAPKLELDYFSSSTFKFEFRSRLMINFGLEASALFGLYFLKSKFVWVTE